MKDFYTADFETCYNEATDSARVWLSCLMDKDGGYVINDNIGGFIADVMAESEKSKNKKMVIYFHNLKYDAMFLIPALISGGYSFNSLISHEKVFYSIRICSGGKVIEIRDSLKKIPFKLKEFSKCFGLEEEKGAIDYNTYRPEGYKATEKEEEYIISDCDILRRGLMLMYEQGYTSSTIGADCFKYFLKLSGGEKKFRHIYPELSEAEDTFLRNAYRGGYCYLNPEYKGKTVKGCTFDINSMYPSILVDYALPFGEGEYGEGKPEGGLWVAKVEASFSLKPGKLPTIPARSFFNTEYMKDSGGELVELYISNYDYELMLEHYDIDEINWSSYYKYRAFHNNKLKQYVEIFQEMKQKAAREGNEGQRTIAKLFSNNLIGKFGTNPKRKNANPVGFDAFGIVWGDEQASDVKTVYLPLALFVNSIGRYKIIKDSQKAYTAGHFIYCDTDSIHVTEGFDASGLNVDRYRLGYYKLEEEFTEGKYVKLKTYIHNVNGQLKLKCSGLSDTLTEIKSVEEFNESLEVEELRQRSCLNGCYLANIRRVICV